MMCRHLESLAAATDKLRSVILPQVTYGPVTIRMAIMTLIMGGTDTTGRRRAS